MGKKKRLILLLLIVCVALLPSCGVLTDNIIPEPEEGVLIYAALNPVSKTLENAVNRFNDKHPEAQIEIRDYSDEGGPQRLLVELAAGRVPDIMELQRIGYEPLPWDANKTSEALWYTTPLEADLSGIYWMPYRRLAQKGYLEDLWPYIENDSEFGRDSVLEAPLKAAEVNGGLYMLFQEVTVNTLIGSKNVVGDRIGWTVEELIEVFSAMPPDSTVLRYNTVQSKVFFALLAPMLDQFVDWETGECFFEDEGFLGMVEFLKCFPAEFDTYLSPEKVEEEIVWRQLDGLQMLETTRIGRLHDIPIYNSYFGGNVTHIGYPTANGSFGGYFIPQGNKLAMSSTSENKDAAWDFIRQLIKQSNYRTKDAMLEAHMLGELTIRINLKDYRLGNDGDLMRAKWWIPPRSTFPGGPEFEVVAATQEDLQVFEYLVNNTTQIYWPDSALSDVVWDAIGPYLAGDRSLEDTIDQVQRRVKLYVNEQM